MAKSGFNNSDKNAILREVYKGKSDNLLYYCMENDTNGALSILNNDLIIKYLTYNLIDEEYNRTPFIWACVNEMKVVINKLIEISKLINDMNKNSIIYLSVRKNLAFNINKKDIYGKTALMYLCNNELYEQFEKLIGIYSRCYMLDYNQGGTQCISGDLDLTIQDNEGNTALRIAVKNGNIKFVEKILEWIHSYDINIHANDGYTPLMIAIMDKNIDLVKILLKKIELDDLLENNQLGIIYEKAKEYCPDCLPEIYKKIMYSIDKLSDKKLEILIQITQEFHPEFLLELYKAIKFKKNRNNLIDLNKKFTQKKQNLKKKTNTSFSSVYTTKAYTDKLNAKKKYNNTEELLKNKIEWILTRIESNELNGYQEAMIKIIYKIVSKYNITDFTEYLEEKYSRMLSHV